MLVRRNVRECRPRVPSSSYPWARARIPTSTGHRRPTAPRVVLISFGTHPDIELPPNGAAVCIGRNHQPYFDDFYVSGDHCVVRVVSDATAPRGCAVAFEMRGQNAAAILRHRLSAEWESAARSDREVVLCHGDVLRLLSINTGAWNYTVAVS